MIVKNEEKVIARLLDCAKQFADEIIIVDTGSTDKTKEITLTKFMISNGVMIFLRQGIFLFQKQPVIIKCGLMLMILYRNKTFKKFWN